MQKTERPARLLTCAEAAEMLGLKEATIRSWVARRTLTYAKIGRSIRIPIESLDQLVHQGTVPAVGGR
jgi:excisionase family DNA binding protein